MVNTWHLLISNFIWVVKPFTNRTFATTQSGRQRDLCSHPSLQHSCCFEQCIVIHYNSSGEEVERFAASNEKSKRVLLGNSPSILGLILIHFINMFRTFKEHQWYIGALVSLPRERLVQTEVTVSEWSGLWKHSTIVT